MPVSTIELILWAPFGVVCLLCAVFFLLAGYRRGLLNALVSLGGTVTAAIASVLLAKLAATALSSTALEALPFMENLGPLGDTLEGLVQSAAIMVLAMVLFIVLVLILTPVCKKLLKLFVRLPKGGLVMRLGGMAVRLVDAVLFALILLAPIYGTLYTYLPVVRSAMALQPEPDEAFVEYMDTAEAHPVVKLSGVGPAWWVYSSLSELNAGEVSVNATALASTVHDVVALVEELEQIRAEGGDVNAATVSLLSYARDNLLQEQWSTQLIANLGMDYLQQSAGLLGGEDSVLGKVLGDLELTPEQLQTDGGEILDLVIGVMQLQSAEQPDVAVAELVEDLGTALNTNETLVDIKDQVLTVAITEALGDDSQETVNAIQEQLQDQTLTAEQQEAQTNAFVQLISGGEPEDALEVLAELDIVDSSLLEQLPTAPQTTE